MHSLVTGGAGFIGSHLVEELLRLGHEVSVIDNLSTGNLSNLAAVAANPGLRVVIDSCANASVVDELVGRCDQVFHLAAAVGVALIVEAPVRTIETNLSTADVILAAASRFGKPVLVASTSEVYGKSDRIPFREDADLLLGPTTKGRWSYACAKAMTEFLALAYAKERRLPVVITRLFNTVGPRQSGRYGMVIPRFVEQALGGHPLTVYGDGTQRRCFAHVRDVVRALVALMRERQFGQVFNVGNPIEISIADLAKQVREMGGCRSELTFVPYEQAYEPEFEDIARRVPDIAKIQRAIGWSPEIAIPQILEDVLAAWSG